MKTDWAKLMAFALVCGIMVGFTLFLLFPDAVAATPTPTSTVREIYLSDHTRCVVVVGGDRGYGNGVGITCDWERRYACDSQRRQP